MKNKQRELLEAYFIRHGYNNHALKEIAKKVIEDPTSIILTEKQALLVSQSGVLDILTEVLKEVGIQCQKITFIDRDINPSLQVQ
jgi:hypothetical protein